jgi:DNA-binding transcriptional LysR family regulator
VLNLDRLAALDAVRRNGSIAAAARELHVTPSGLSQQLARLEQEVGHEITARQGRGLRLTSAGVLLAQHAESILADVRSAETDLADLHAEILGPLRIGSVPSAIRLLLASVLADLRADHPRLHPLVFEDESVDSLPLLATGELDLVLGEQWENRPLIVPADIHREVLLTEPVHIALPAGHPLADRAEVSVADLGDTSWISCGIGEDREALIGALTAQHIAPRIDFTVTEYPTQLHLVAAGVGCALSPLYSSGKPPHGVVTRPSTPPLLREIYVAWRESNDPPPVRACIAALRAHAHDHDHRGAASAQ